MLTTLRNRYKAGWIGYDESEKDATDCPVSPAKSNTCQSLSLTETQEAKQVLQGLALTGYQVGVPFYYFKMGSILSDFLANEDATSWNIAPKIHAQ